jgi:hypothetical protein
MDSLSMFASERRRTGAKSLQPLDDHLAHDLRDGPSRPVRDRHQSIVNVFGQSGRDLIRGLVGGEAWPTGLAVRARIIVGQGRASVLCC